MSNQSFFVKIVEIAKEYNLEPGLEFFNEFINERKEDSGNINIYFLEMFENLSKKFILQLGEASNLYYYSLLAADKMIDNKNVLINQEALLLSHLIRERSLHLMYQLLSSKSDYWTYFDKYYLEYVKSIALELNLNKSHETDINLLEIENVYKGKSAMMKACTTAMAIEAGKPDLIKPLEESLDFYQIALALVDDLNDWKHDFVNEQFNYLIRKTIITNNIDIKSIKDPNIIGKYLFFSGEAVSALKLAIDYTQKAIKEVSFFEKNEWQNAIKRLEKKCIDLVEDIEMLVEKELISNGLILMPTKTINLPEIKLKFTKRNKPVDSMIKYCLSHIIDDWKDGYQDVMVSNYFAKRDDFRFDKRYYAGDVFQRAVIGDILYDISLKMNNSLIPFLQYEIDNLIKNRRKNGWWNFYNDFPYQPCDADTTAQVIQVLMKMSQNHEIKQHTEQSIDTFLKWHFDDEGGIGTWFLPPIEKCNDEELMQRHFYKDYIGLDIDITRDIEVMSNFLFALHRFNSEKYKRYINKGIEYIEKKQFKNGHWKNSWYCGPYYGIYTCIRLLNEAKPDSVSIPYAIRYITRTQNADGGWGWQTNQSDPLNTSYALLCIHALAQRSYKQNPEITEKALSYLSNAIYSLQEMNKSSYINFQKKNALATNSKVITYSYVLKSIFT